MNRFVRPNKDAAAMRESCAQGAFWSMPRTEEMVGSYFVESDATGKIVANKMQLWAFTKRRYKGGFAQDSEEVCVEATAILPTRQGQCFV